MNTLVIERKTTKVDHTTVSLPYYATTGPDKMGWETFFAITGEADNMKLQFYGEGRPPRIGFCEAGYLPEDVQQCSEDYFKSAYERCQLAITERFLSACPSAKAPEVSNLQSA